MENLRQPLLGRLALQALRLVALVELIDNTDVVSQFPVFKGLGKLKDNYVIKLYPVCPNYTSKSAAPSSTQSKGGTPKNGVTRDHHEHQGADRLVCKDGGGPEAERQGQDLCLFNKAK